MLFVGTHERQLDDKGRLAMPAPFRTHLGEHCYVVFGPDRCLEVYPAAVFEQIAGQLMDRVDRGEISRQRQRVVSSSATLVSRGRSSWNSSLISMRASCAPRHRCGLRRLNAT